MQSLLAYIIWDPTPEIIPGLPFRWYGLFFALSFLFGYLIIRKMFTLEKIPFYHMEKMALPIVLGTVGGARIGHILFYEPAHYLANPWEIPMVWKGGLASHGAAIGLIIAIIWYARKANWKPLWLFDRLIVPIALAALFIRCGNFINSEILGKETTLPWGVVFQQADQNPPYMMAAWKDGNVELTFTADARRTNRFEVFRQMPDSSLVLAGKVDALQGGESYFFSEPSPGNGRLDYFIRDERRQLETIIKPVDSNDTRTIILFSPALPDSTLLLRGTWQGTKLNIKCNATPGWKGARVALWYSTDRVNWRILEQTEVKEGGIAFETNHEPGKEKDHYYRLVNGTEDQGQINLFARHPSMLYEGAINFFIFLFLYMLYNKRKGKVRYGELFGYFLILLFTVRILIEFTKIEQTDFQHSMPLNMGQMLSLPLVIAGFYILLRSRKASDESPVEEEKEIPKNKKS